jgi:hypothetical protein
LERTFDLLKKRTSPKHDEKQQKKLSLQGMLGLANVAGVLKI